MPRKDGNTPKGRRQHHAPMHSGRKGEGCDRKRKTAKQEAARHR